MAGINTIWGVLAVAVALGTDSFSIALGLGLSGASRFFRVRFVVAVALMHVFMPLLGLVLGTAAGSLLGRWAGVVGGVVLAIIGILMLRKSFEKEEGISLKNAKDFWENKKPAGSRRGGWLAILALALSVSIDALTVGFGLGTARVNILNTVLITGTVAGLMTAAGWLAARYSSEIAGQRAQTAGGIILILLAAKMVFL